MRRRLADIMVAVRDVLEREGERSIRQLAIRVGANWESTSKALHYLQALGVVTERDARSSQGARLFRLKRER